MGRMLQRLYDMCGAVAGILILCICLLISAQIVLNGMGRFARCFTINNPVIL